APFWSLRDRYRLNGRVRVQPDGLHHLLSEIVIDLWAPIRSVIISNSEKINLQLVIPTFAIGDVVRKCSKMDGLCSSLYTLHRNCLIVEIEFGEFVHTVRIVAE